MALAKFSKFKKERSVIKEARSKETKIKAFNKLFNEKISELGLTSTADLSEDQISKIMASLSTVNEDRMREIEKDGIIAGTPKPSGSEGEVAQKHTFKSPQVADQESEADAEDMKAVEEAKKAVKENGTEGEDDEEKSDHYKDAAKDDYAQIADLKKDAHDDKESEDHYEEEEEEEEEEEVSEGKEIKSEKEFDDYADDLLKKAHPDDFDEATAKKVKDGLKKKYKDNFGAMVGALTSGFGG